MVDWNTISAGCQRFFVVPPSVFVFQWYRKALTFKAATCSDIAAHWATQLVEWLCGMMAFYNKTIQNLLSFSLMCGANE